jgi:hypothetical protein
MPVTTTTQDGITTINFAYSKDTDIILEKGDKAAHYLWNLGHGDHGTQDDPVSFDSLTNQDKLNLIGLYLLTAIHEAAAGYVAECADIDKETALDTERANPLDF